MSIFEIILTGIALAMDAFALTIANCTSYKDSLTLKKEWAMPITFAVFQFLMPVIGFFIGSLFSSLLQSIAGILTAIVFFVLCFKIVFDQIKSKKEESEKIRGNFNFLTLLLQGVATSIDALLVGVTFVAYFALPFIPSMIIGITTFVIVAVALFIGKSLGKILGKYATWVGAIILFSLAVKNLIEALI